MTARETEVLALIARHLTNAQIGDAAEQLNAAGLKTGHGHPFDVKAVQWIRHAYGIPAPEPYADGEVSVAGAAGRLGCSTGVIYYWIKTGQLTTRRGPGNRLCIAWDAATETACRERIAASGHLNPGASRTKPRKRPAARLSSPESQHLLA